MDWFMLGLLLVCVKAANIAPAGSFHKDYISREGTTPVKGVFAVLIIFSHYIQYIAADGAWDGAYMALRSHLNQAVVIMFLFYSGFGMMESIGRKGVEYVKGIPRRRLLPLLIRFDVIVLIYFVMQLCLGRNYGLDRLPAALVGWDGFGNSNWYVFGVLGEYVLMFAAFVAMAKWNGKGSKYVYAAVFTALTAAFALAIRASGRDDYWYNTLMMFPLGVWFSLLRRPVERLVMRSGGTYALTALITAVLYLWSFDHRWGYGLKGYTLWAAMFAAVTVLLTMKIEFRSPVLNWFGDHVFGVYMLQRIPMILLSRAGWTQAHPYGCLVVTLLATVCLAMAFEAAEKQILKKVKLKQTERGSLH